MRLPKIAQTTQMPARNAAEQERRRPDEQTQALVALDLGLVRADRDRDRGGLLVDRRHSAAA
jgi:hypothetical protein